MNIPRLTVLTGCLAAALALLWWLLALPHASWYAAHTADLEHVALVLVWIAAVAQTLFVLLWMTQPWFHTGWITRAIMIKSAGLALLLDTSLIHYYIPVYAAEQAVGVLVIALVMFGAVSQLVALGYETWRGRRRDTVDR